MKTTNKVLAIAVLVLGAQAAQAHIADGVEHTHEARSQFQTMSATDRLNFRDENKANMELMSTEDRQAFRDNMQSMSTEDRQAFRDSMGGGQGGGMGQGMRGGSQGSGYGRGYGK